MRKPNLPKLGWAYACKNYSAARESLVRGAGGGHIFHTISFKELLAD